MILLQLRCSGYKNYTKSSVCLENQPQQFSEKVFL